MARLPNPGGDDGIWGDVLNDYLSTQHNSDGTHKSDAVPDASSSTKGKIRLSRDLGGTSDDPIVTGLQGRNVASTAPTNGQLLSWDNVAANWKPTDPSGVSFAAPTGGIDIGDSSVEGSASTATRSDHQHGFSAPAAGYPQDVAAAEVDGTATTPARSDHVHAHGSGYLPDAHHNQAHSDSDHTGANKVAIQKAGTAIGTRKTLNLIEGSNVTLTVTDNAGSDRVDITVASSGGSNVNEQTFTTTSTLTVATGNVRWYAPYALTINEVRASVGTAPTGASVIVDVNKNGTTIFTTQSNRPTIAAGTNTDLADGIDVSSLAAGDYLTVDVDQIGSTAAGADLTVTIKYTVS